MAYNYTNPVFNGVPNNYHGLSTRYLADAVVSGSWDLIAKGGYRHLNKGLLFGRPLGGLEASYFTNVKGSAIFTLPYSAYRAMKAPKGHKAAAGLGAIVGSTLPAIFGTVLGGPLGGIIAEATVAAPLEKAVAKSVDKFVEIGRFYNHPHMGGNYIDNQKNWTMRQRAAQEIATGLMSARQHLGNEAMLSHQ